MTFFDLILLIGIFGFVLAGLWLGFIHSLGAVIGTVLSVLVAGRYYEGWAHAVQSIFFGNLNLARVVMFLLIMILVNRLIGLVFWLIEKVFRIVAVLPFLKTINALAGAALGLVEGVFVIGGALYIAARYPVTESFVAVLSASHVGLWLLHAFGLLAPLLPPALRTLRSIV